MYIYTNIFIIIHNIYFIRGRLGRELDPGSWEGDTAESFSSDAALRVMPLEGRVTSISSSQWTLGLVMQLDSTGYFPQPNQFS